MPKGIILISPPMLMESLLGGLLDEKYQFEDIFFKDDQINLIVSGNNISERPVGADLPRLVITIKKQPPLVIEKVEEW